MKLPITLAVGVDLVKILRIEALLAKPRGPRFLQRVLHSSERVLLPSLSNENRARYVSGCWATKEAVYKTLPTVKQRKFTFCEWYRYLKDGIPCVGSDMLTDEEFKLSISHDDGLLIATVLRQRIVEIK